MSKSLPVFEEMHYYDLKQLFSTKVNMDYGVSKNAEFYVDPKFVEMDLRYCFGRKLKAKN
jgi:hypothetical protein